MKRLKKLDVIALGFMTFALFLGAGNIIFPPFVGLQAGDKVWLAAFGFLLTGVGLPLLTVVALARVGGGIAELTAPIGRWAGILFAVPVYLAIGPLFATPRTAVVSFEMGIAPLVGESDWALASYSALYFIVVMALSLNPGRLIDRIGKVITPVLIVALVILGCAAIWMPIGPIGLGNDAYDPTPVLSGFGDGYLTMDTLGALVFGVVVTGAIRARGITDERSVTHYTMIAGCIAAVCLSLVYLSLFYLGATSEGIASGAKNGVQVLTIYVDHTFGGIGSLLLAVVITLACLTTAVGLISACGQYFSRLTGLSHRAIVVIFSVLSMLVANLGLDLLISVSEPVLVALYPLAIALVGLCLMSGFLQHAPRIFIPVMIVTLGFGVVDGISAAGFNIPALDIFKSLPLSEQKLGWLLPTLATLVISIIVDRCLGRIQTE